MTIDIIWTTILDPRCRSLKHLNVNEKKHAKNILIDEVINIIKAEKVSEAPIINVISDDDHDKSPVKAFSTTEIERHDEDTIKQRSELVEASAKREVENIAFQEYLYWQGNGCVCLLRRLLQKESFLIVDWH